MNVVIPSGIHGLVAKEDSRGLSCLLGRLEVGIWGVLSLFFVVLAFEVETRGLKKNPCHHHHHPPHTPRFISGKMVWFGSKVGSSGYSSTSTAEQVTEGIDGTGLTAIVTGASSGIGVETTRILALRGVHVVMAVRNVDSGNKVREDIVKETTNAKIDVMELDLSSMESIKNFASKYISSSLPLNILINNAGVLSEKFVLSKDDIEISFATNYIGHFLLTNLLLDTMKNTVKETKLEGRIVNVSSEGHNLPFFNVDIRFDKINDESSYNAKYAYGQSKLANILHANELARRLKAKRVEITANSLHPGFIGTGLMRGQQPYAQAIFYFLTNITGKNMSQGAATQCYLALHPQVKGISGEYFSDCNIGKASFRARNEDLGKKLWDLSMSLTKSAM